ncbi:hypothetical protein N7G274_006558 [Stereocaulon virgatum]|uniref:Ankyrin n=1 Tax=Stereocaulon virgatum TaxID=373712 RepID=A0ABR4A740_9LECA
MPTATATIPTPKLPPDQISDLLYLSRTGETTNLTSTLTHLAKNLSTTPSALLATTTDPETGNTLLHMASANGHTETITCLVALFASTASSARLAMLDRRNGAGNAPLHWAALNGHLDAVKELVGAGADLDGTNGAGRKAVDEAEGAGRVEVREWLRVRGKEVGEAEEGAEDGEGVEDGEVERWGAEDGEGSGVGEQDVGGAGVGKS